MDTPEDLTTSLPFLQSPSQHLRSPVGLTRRVATWNPRIKSSTRSSHASSDQWNFFPSKHYLRFTPQQDFSIFRLFIANEGETPCPSSFCRDMHIHNGSIHVELWSDLSLSNTFQPRPPMKMDATCCSHFISDCLSPCLLSHSVIFLKQQTIYSHIY